MLKKITHKYLIYNSLLRYKKISQHIRGESLLDVGCAEGWVTYYAHEKEGYNVQLVDVVDLNETDLNFKLYDGKSLPFPDNSFDTVTALLTLHHCESPSTVLDEIYRVAKKRVIVTESVYHTRPGKMLLSLLDGGFNTMRSDGQISTALHFKTCPQWRKIFADKKLKVIKENWLTRGIHNQRLFVLEK
mgnify:CR=1 FL=1